MVCCNFWYSGIKKCKRYLIQYCLIKILWYYYIDCILRGPAAEMEEGWGSNM